MRLSTIPNRTPREKLAAFMDHHLVDQMVAGLILVSVLLLFAELVTKDTRLVLMGQIITAAFVVELSLRCIAARSKKEFFGEYWIDIASVLPLFHTWRLLRFLRLLRILRIGPLMMRSNRRLRGILRQSFGEQIHIVVITAVTILGIGLALMEVEGSDLGFRSVGDSLWWALMSVVMGEPYGATPQTPLGRLFTLVAVLVGMTVFAIFTGTVSAVMAERFRVRGTRNPMHLSDLHDHIVICGWNRSGPVVVGEIHASPEWHERAVVLVAEKRPPDLDQFDKDPLFFFLEADCTRADVLQHAGIERAARAILMADKSVAGRPDQDRDARTLLTALTIEKISPGIFSVAELLSRDNQQHLVMAGIEEVVIADEYSGTLLASSARVRGLTELAADIFSSKYGNQIYKRAIRPEWAGKTFLEVSAIVKRDHDATLISLERALPENERVNGPAARNATSLTNPPADEKVRSTDALIVLATKEPTW